MYLGRVLVWLDCRVCRLILPALFIKELELIGFKSFRGKATLRLSRGMNAIVGPNGCGKSNILDALRWVLGEQSFALLRCARNEDLIFSGSAQSPALNMAEVRLVLATEDVPELGAELEIKRRYFRSGESEYFLNRQQCRLRDITDLFLSSGIGTKAYSIFDLRQIREIVSGNIRRMFDEAAQLAKYQEAKAECQRKLELTAADLVRLEDIIAERERVVRGLRRQAARLRAYQRLKDEEKVLRLVELKLGYESLVRELAAAQSDEQALEQAEAERLASIHRLEDELRKLRLQVRERQAQRERLLARARQLRNAQAELEAQSILDRQRAELLEQAAAVAERRRQNESVAALERLFAETAERLKGAGERVAAANSRLASARQRVSGLEQRLYELRTQEGVMREQAEEQLEVEQRDRSALARLEAIRDNLIEAIERQREELVSIRSRRERAESEAITADQQRSAAEARLAELRQQVEVQRRQAGRILDELRQVREQMAGLREEQSTLDRDAALLRRALVTEQAQNAAGVIGDGLAGEVCTFLEVSEGWERACEAALYHMLDFLSVSRSVTRSDLEVLFRSGPQLRYGFLLPQSGAGSSAVLQESDGVALPRLSEYVKVRPNAPALLLQTVETFLVAPDGADLNQLAETYPGWNLVTREGVARFADGRLVMEGADRGQLSAGRRLRAVSQRLAEVQSTLVECVKREGSLREQESALQRELSQYEAELVETDRQRAGLAAAAAAAASVLADLKAEEQRAMAELRRLEAQRQAAEEKATSLGARLAKVESGSAARAQELARLQVAIAEHEALVKEALQESAQAVASLGEEQQQVSRLETELAYVKRTIEEAERRVRALASESDAQRQEAARLRQAADERRTAIEQRQQEAVELETQAEGLTPVSIAEAEEELERNLAELRETRERNQRLVIDQRLRRHDLEQRVAAIVAEAQTSHRTDIVSYTPEPIPDFEERRSSVRRRLEALGAVNPLATDEFEQERKDLSRLVAQRDDVVRAKANLEQTMVELDRHARDQFLQTYGEVREHFQEIFRRLFLEGEADLLLLDEANPLQSEVAIVARPRGKNPKRLEQLSDGEKALLAVSLLFAFYRVKPAPFCFLDEVDAPLDDVNVGRFADYLQELSRQTQVIVITHNRATVERAATLFGVTAEQPGISQLVAVSLAQFSGAGAGG